MRVLKEFEVGQPIPEGAVLIRHEERNDGPVREELWSVGFLWNTYRRWQPTKTVYIYEVDQ